MTHGRMNRIAIIGPGAIGGTVAAWLAQSKDNDITLCARTAIESLEVQTPAGTIEATPRCLTDVKAAVELPAADRTFDWVLIATKAYDAKATAQWLPALTAPHTRLAVLQNGVEHVDRFAEWWPREKILPAVVECPVERIAPGRILQRRDAWIAVPQSSAGAAFAALFPNPSIEVRLTADFTTVAWRKLCLNAAGAVSALVMKPAGIVHLDDIAELMRGLIRECIAIGRAEGAVLDDELVEEIIAGSRAGSPDSINSMLADRLAARPMEIDARNGVVVRRGAKYGIAAPLNQLMVTLLNAAAA